MKPGPTSKYQEFIDSLEEREARADLIKKYEETDEI